MPSLVNMSFLTFLTTLLSLVNFSIAGYALEDDYSPATFFDMFSFWTSADPTNGFVDYVDQTTATEAGYITNSTFVYIGTDHTNTSPNGRPSVRLTSNKSYNSGSLIILDLEHMPGGICGTWPAFWMVGPNWPDGGEIDIIEGVNTQTTNAMTLHTSNGCSITDNNNFTGTIETDNCYIYAEDQSSNAGCDISTTDTYTYGEGFNAIGGGVYATEWTDSAISIWFFPRGSVPSDITDGTPNPSGWGEAMAQFQGGCDIPEFFSDNQIVFDLTYCGDWAGNVWSSGGCAASTGVSTCDAYVENNPAAFANAYWVINSLKVYQSSATSDDTALPSTTTSTTKRATTTSTSKKTTTTTTTSKAPTTTTTSKKPTTTTTTTSKKPTTTTTSKKPTTTTTSKKPTTTTTTSKKPTTTTTTSKKPTTTSKKTTTSTKKTTTTSKAPTTLKNVVSTTSKKTSTTSSKKITTTSKAVTTSKKTTTISKAVTTSKKTTTTTKASSTTTKKLSISTVKKAASHATTSTTKTSISVLKSSTSSMKSSTSTLKSSSSAVKSSTSTLKLSSSSTSHTTPSSKLSTTTMPTSSTAKPSSSTNKSQTTSSSSSRPSTTTASPTSSSTSFSSSSSSAVSTTATSVTVAAKITASPSQQASDAQDLVADWSGTSGSAEVQEVSDELEAAASQQAAVDAKISAAAASASASASSSNARRQLKSHKRRIFKRHG